MKQFSTAGFVASVVVVAFFAAPVAAQDMMSEDSIMADSGDITVTPIHHASTMLTWNDLTILVDPAPALGGPEGADVTAEYTALPSPDIILVTHQHGDHFNVDILEAVAGDDTPIIVPQDVADKMPDDLNANVMANGDTATVAGVQIEAVPAYNITEDRLQFHPQGRDNGYVVTLGGTRIYFAGDTEDTPEMRALSDIDVAFLPMNLPYTMDIDHAADAVKAFSPKVVYPYHYGESDVTAFKTMVGDTADVRLLKWY